MKIKVGIGAPKNSRDRLSVRATPAIPGKFRKSLIPSFINSLGYVSLQFGSHLAFEEIL